jgi:hypothetical protein
MSVYKKKNNNSNTNNYNINNEIKFSNDVDVEKKTHYDNLYSDNYFFIYIMFLNNYFFINIFFYNILNSDFMRQYQQKQKIKIKKVYQAKNKTGIFF